MLDSFPKAEHVTDFANIVLSGGANYASLHADLSPDDEVSMRAVRALGLGPGRQLPSQAVATPKMAFKLQLEAQHSEAPTTCAWERTAIFFIRLYNAGNLCHLLNEAVLPLLALTLPVAPPREIYVFTALQDPTAKHTPLPLFQQVAQQLGHVAPIAHFFESLQPPGSRSVTRNIMTRMNP